MVFGGMNYLAILVAAAASYAFGAGYYHLLGRRWRAALGSDEPAGDGRRTRTYVIAAVALVVMAFVLAGSIGHLGPGQVTVRNGIISGAILWAGMVLTTTAVNYAFQNRRAALTLIDAGHWLGVLLLQGLIIGLFGV